MVQKFFYRCSDCKTEYQTDRVHYLCPLCAAKNQEGQPPRGVLSAVYPWEELKIKYAGKNGLLQMANDCFLPILPIQKLTSLGYLKVGNTPLYHVKPPDNKDYQLYLKDDSQNPTFSYKDRASVMISAFAAENGIETIVAASTGNAGSSLAGICAANKQKAIVFVPASAPLAKLTQIILYGAQIIPVASNYDAAFELSIKATEHFGWYNRNTAFNPITIEGKKTSAFEIVLQNNGRVPDRIFVPVGDGVIISGIYKGFEDLYYLGLINHMPIIVAVQSEKSQNLIHNLHRFDFEVIPATTLADSISVDIPRNYWMAAGFLKKYQGETVLVSDHVILEASALLARSYGIFSEPAGAAAFAGLLHYAKNHRLHKGTENMVMLTGSGLKDLRSVAPFVKLPEPVAPNMDAVKQFLLQK